MKFVLCSIFILNGASIAAFAAEPRCMSITERASSASPSNTVRVVDVKPPAGSSVHKWTELVADIDYDVEDFSSGNYILVAQFDTTQEGHSTDGSFSFDKYPQLTYASGSFRLCFPLKDVWEQLRVKRPFSVRFFLSKID